MPSYTTMTTCTRAQEVYEEPTVGASSGTHFDVNTERARKRRRHSSYNPRSWSVERENAQLMVDRFLGDLGRRLDLLESYGQLKFDKGVNSIHGVLTAVHEKCGKVSDDFFDAGRRRHKILVEMLEAHYKEAMAKRDTFEQKMKDGVKMLEINLAAVEQKAYAMRQNGLAAAASEIVDSGLAYMDRTSTKAAEMMYEGADKARRAKEQMKLKIEVALVHARKHGLLTYEMLPEPWRVNPHIMRGYRFSETKLDCVRSCFVMSNEFFNIWSHAIGLLIVLGLAFYVYPSTPAFTSATKWDIFVAGCFFFAACKCLVCSTVWHAMSSISNQTLLNRFACVDYTGISLLVAASIMTTEYTAFYCEPWSRLFYMSTTFILGVAGSILAWSPTFNRSDLPWLRVGFYVSLACTGFIPIAQLTYQRGWSATLYFYAPITKSILVYLGGACLYAAKIPERFLPGWFDYVGCSHNVWHLAVLGGILFHYTAMQSFFGAAFRRAEVGCSIY